MIKIGFTISTSWELNPRQSLCRREQQNPKCWQCIPLLADHHLFIPISLKSKICYLLDNRRIISTYPCSEVPFIQLARKNKYLLACMWPRGTWLNILADLAASERERIFSLVVQYTETSHRLPHQRWASQRALAAGEGGPQQFSDLKFHIRMLESELCPPLFPPSNHEHIKSKN